MYHYILQKTTLFDWLFQLIIQPIECWEILTHHSILVYVYIKKTFSYTRDIQHLQTRYDKDAWTLQCFVYKLSDLVKILSQSEFARTSVADDQAHIRPRKFALLQLVTFEDDQPEDVYDYLTPVKLYGTLILYLLFYS